MPLASSTLSSASALAGADAAFIVVFGAFVLAFVVLAFITLRWAVRRDRTGRDQWLRRQAEQGAAGGTGSAVPSTDGSVGPMRRGRRRGPPR
jgi:hypothetical protein